MRDFTFKILQSLFSVFQKQGYKFITFKDYCLHKIPTKFIIMRHDVDRKAEFALSMAKLESLLGIESSYYFRCKKGRFEDNIIREIMSLGHEVGYHYETLAKAGGNFSKAIDMFESDLECLRNIADIKTICAHGSPFSKWDSRNLWKRYDFKHFAILGEPNFTLNFNKVLYLTDTGRRWNGESVSVRDKVNSKFAYNFKSTFDIIKSLNNNDLPAKLMVNTHPHRWTDKSLLWLKELLWQNTKNIGKRILAEIYQ
jgi:hypothetical protein